MTKEYSLAHLSMIEVPPVGLVRAAQHAGFTHTGFRLTPTSSGIDHGILGNGVAIRELKAAIDDSGVGILDLEVIRITGDGPTADPMPLFEAAEYLGARYVITTLEDPDPVRRVEALALLAEQAAEYQVALSVEFMLFSAAPTLQAACEAVIAAGAPNVVVLADVLHLVRSGGAPDDMLDYPARLFPYVQICGAEGASAAPDAATARAEAVTARLMPDQGDLPVREFTECIPTGAILSVESPLAGLGNPSDPAALAVDLLASARRACE
jgi:sugar phosphate isomerase/epimerase